MDKTADAPGRRVLLSPMGFTREAVAAHRALTVATVAAGVQPFCPPVPTVP